MPILPRRNTFRMNVTDFFDDPNFIGYLPIAVATNQFNTSEALFRVHESTAGQIHGFTAYSDFNDDNNVAVYQTSINGVLGTIIITIPTATSGAFSDLTHTDKFAAGDYLSCKLVTSATTGTLYLRKCFGLSFAATGNAPVRYSSTTFARAANTTFYYTTQSLSSATEATAQWNIDTTGTWQRLMAKVQLNSTTATSTVRSRKNTANGNQVVTVASGLTGEFEDTSNTDTIANGDDICYQLVAGTTGTSIQIIYQSEFAETNGKTLVIWSGAQSYAFGTTSFYGMSGDISGAITTEDWLHCNLPARATASKLQVRAFTNTVNGTTTVRSRKNAANGNMSVSIGSSLTGYFEDAVNTDSLLQGDAYNYSAVRAGTSGAQIICGISSLLDGGLDAGIAGAQGMQAVKRASFF